MTETALYRLWMLPGAAFLIASGAVFLCINGQNLPRFEKIPRNRYFGLLTGWFALAWCIPHAQAVAPSFLLPFMWPLAVIVPIAGFFCLDYMTSRAVGGIFIILAYEALHRSFNLDLPLAGVIAITSWLLGACGIWISGIPHHLRDAIRQAGTKKKWKYIYGISLIAAGILFAISGVCLI